MWLSPCCKAQVETVSTWIAHEPCNQKCAKCGDIHKPAELKWEPPRK
jgi:hypothetical protein